MALIVENGSIVPNADSYISVADACAYLVSRGNKTFAGTATADQEAALRNATDFMVAQYRNRWAGERILSTQILDWPRAAVPLPDVGGWYGGVAYIAPDVVPVPVQQACADLAVRALLGPLSPDVGRVKSEVKLGPLSVKYDPNYAVTATFVAVLTKLAPYMTGQGMRVSLVRT
jgi:hypothetical protein